MEESEQSLTGLRIFIRQFIRQNHVHRGGSIIVPRVRIGAIFQKHAGKTETIIFARPVEGGFAGVILRVHVGAAGEEELYKIFPAKPAYIVERCPAGDTPGVGIAASVKGAFHSLEIEASYCIVLPYSWSFSYSTRGSRPINRYRETHPPCRTRRSTAPACSPGTSRE